MHPRNVRRSSQELTRLKRRGAATRRQAALRPSAYLPGELARGESQTPPPVAVGPRAPELIDLGEASPLTKPRRRWLSAVLLVLVAVAMLATVVIRSMGSPARAMRALREFAPARLAGGVGHGALLSRGQEGVEADGAEEASQRELDVKHDGHASIRGGVLFTPSTFRSIDGSYDLYIHFHGNTRVVRESAEVAGLNAVVAVINLGVGSGPYEESFKEPGRYERLLESIDRALAHRGVSNPKRRRVALGGWSAGYGAISSILQVRRGVDDLDAILMLDGIHCGFEPTRDGDFVLNSRQMAPFVGAARKAAAGEMLFSITHSEIDPREYASSGATAAYLLRSVGGEPALSDEFLPHLDLVSVVGAVAKSRERTMDATIEGRVGGFHVRAYMGELPEDHMAHLFQMGATVLPELVERWDSTVVEGGEARRLSP